MKELAKHIVLDFMQMQEFVKDPFIVAEGGTIRIRDVDGKEYIDGLSGVFVTSVGHANQAVIDATVNQLQRLAFAPPLHATNPPALELAQLLTEISPPGFTTVKLLSGGSEATEAAMKMARQYHVQTGNPRKFKVVGMYGSYHGATMGALSATGGWDRKSIYEPLMPGFYHVHPADCYWCPYDHSYPGCKVTCARMVDRVIEAEDPKTVSAVIASPAYISSAGFIVPPMEYFQSLREICDRHNVLLIFDEIITGFGRMGRMFGADYFNVVPDFICCGKGMSGGYSPLAAVLIQDRINQAFLGAPEERKEFHHGHTFGGNPVSAAAGLATIRQILDRDLVGNSRTVGAYLHGKLEQVAQRFPFVGDTRGAGLLQGFQLVKDQKTRSRLDPSAKIGSKVAAAAKSRGLLLRTGGDFAALAPPLIVTKGDVDEMSQILEESLAEVSAQL